MAKEEALEVLGMGCSSSCCDFKPYRFQRRAPGPGDVVIDIKYCGVCHSDVHFAAAHFKAFGFNPEYPFVPGHELAGVCVAVGSKVQKFKLGDHVGVGCMVDSCLQCSQCEAGHEQKCKRQVSTYGAKDANGRAAVWPPGSKTKGGYCNKMVVHERFGIFIPKSYPLECAGPVFCAGITMYDPMMEYGFKAGDKVAITGLGGLGQMGVMIAKELGCIVTVISRGKQKESLARKLGAVDYVNSTDEEAMEMRAKSLDFVIDTIPVHHNIDPYTPLLKDTGKMIMVAACPTMYAAHLFGVSKQVKASIIGGVKRTEDLIKLLDTASPKILPGVCIKPVHEPNSIFEVLDAGNDAGVRFVLDIQGSLSEDAFGTCNAAAPKLKTPEGLDMTTFLYEGLKLAGFACC